MRGARTLIWRGWSGSSRECRDHWRDFRGFGGLGVRGNFKSSLDILLELEMIKGFTRGIVSLL